jgi:hypothetical protein
MTRARDVLHVSYVSRAANGPKVVDLAASRFLYEAGLLAEVETDAEDAA